MTTRGDTASVHGVASPSLYWPTAAVIAGQCAFMCVAYSHAAIAGELTLERFHISAVLDDDVRCVICACVGAVALVTLTFLEWKRDLPHPKLRIGLAALCGVGIILTCVIREKAHDLAHRLVAALGFGAAVLLTLLIANLDVTHRGRKAAIALATTLILTGAAQGLNLVGKLYLELGFDVLPSWALGCLEIVLVLGFGVCMALCVCAGAGTATLRSGRESP